MFLLAQNTLYIFVNCGPPSEQMDLGQPKMSNEVVSHLTTEAVEPMIVFRRLGIRSIDQRKREMFV